MVPLFQVVYNNNVRLLIVNGQVSVKKQRLVNFDLFTLSMPTTANTSIFYRVSGAALFFCSVSPFSTHGFELIKSVYVEFIARLFTVITATAAVFYRLTGLQQILLKMSFFEDLGSTKNKINFGLIPRLSIAALLGAYLW